MTHNVVAIKNSVGDRGGVNTPNDVEVVQELLSLYWHGTPAFRGAVGDDIEVDGKVGDQTIGAIRGFQKVVLKWSPRSIDGRVDPGGKTWTALNQNLMMSRDIKPVGLDPETTGAVESALGNSGSYTKFRQLDYSKNQLGYRYGEDKDEDGVADKSKSIASAGCAMCSLTMAATRVGCRTKYWPKGLAPKDLTPLKANEILKKAGAFSGYMLVMTKAARALGMAPVEYGFNKSLPSNALELLTAHLKADKPAAAHVDYKGGSKGDHWVVLTGISGGKYTAIDPASGDVMTFTTSSTHSARHKEKKHGILFGEAGKGAGPKTRKNQPNYCVVRFILLATMAGTSSAN